MILEVTIIRLEFEDILISYLDEYRKRPIERLSNPEVFYEIEQGELARVNIANKVFSMMECRYKLALYLQKHKGFETVGKEVPLEYDFVIENNTFARATVKTYEFKEEEI